MYFVTRFEFYVQTSKHIVEPTSVPYTRSQLSGKEDVPVAPLYLQRRWARISRQYMLEYSKGANGSDAIKAVKAYRHTKHRDTADGYGVVVVD